MEHGIKRPTVVVDIDGTIFKYFSSYEAILEAAQGHETEKQVPLPGVVAKMQEWYKKGYCIVVMSARDYTEEMIEYTSKQLADFNIPYDILVLGVSNGKRYMINDTKPDMPGQDTAIGVTVPRDGGFEHLDI